MNDYLEQQNEWARRADSVQAPAAQAYSRLLTLTEQRDSGQILRVAQFVAATYNGTAFPLDPFILRTLDVDISDDMLLCLDALRWGRTDLHSLVPDGARRIEAMCTKWGLRSDGDK